MIVAAVGGFLLMAMVVAAYYVISYGVLYLVGKAFPLAGRRRR